MRTLRSVLAVPLALLLVASSALAQSPTPPEPVGSAAPAPPTPVATPREPRIRALAEQEVFGFLPYWELANAERTVDLDRLTTLAWFGVEANRNGRLVWKSGNGNVPGGAAGWRDPRWLTLMQRAQAQGVRVVLTIERFSWTAKNRDQTIRLLSRAGARKRLIGEITAEVVASGADGVNLDFEPLPSDVREEFTQFVRDLRTAFDAVSPELQITFDITADIDSYDIAALTADDAADAVFLMAYDFRGASAPFAAAISPLDDTVTGFDIRSTVADLLTVADPAHTILGLPWYGRAWTTEGPEPFSPTRSGKRLTGPGISLYRDALGIARANGRHYDPISATAWTVYVRTACDTCPEAWRQVWYDDVDAFAAKIAFAQEQGMGGVGIWALGYTGDYQGMWTVIGLAGGSVSDDTPPTGEATIASGSAGRHDGLPVVTGTIDLGLSARDAQGGSGLAFVRIANDGTLDADGALATGSTWPATPTVTWSLTDGPVVVPPAPRPTATPRPTRTPRATRAPESEAPTATAEPTPVPTAPPVQAARTIFVQWRDVAGNWSAPVTLEVWYAPEGSVLEADAPSGSPVASQPAPSPASGSPAPSAVPASAEPTPEPQ